MTDQKEQERKSILLIDDDTSLLVTLSDFLRFEGYDVTTADSGEQGLAKLTRIDPDLIILDMSMPGMGGIGFLKEVSTPQGDPKYPILVLTARANMAEFFANVNVDGFVAKPCDPNDLLMEVSRIIFLRSGEVEETKPSGRDEKRSILLGEDDETINSKLAGALSEAGYIVEHVGTGPDVLEKAIVGKPDLVVLKRVLANMNGDAVASVMKDMPNTSGIPIVLYDDTDEQLPESRFVDGRTGIRKYVRGNDAKSLLAAIGHVLKS